MVKIRPMTMDDVIQVAEIEQECFTTPWSLNSFEQAVHMNHTIFLVAEVVGEIVGYCGILYVLDEGNITNIAVRDSYRGKGIGRKLMEEAMKIANNNNVFHFLLEVRRSNKLAIALYESLGFVEEGIRKNFYQHPTEDAFIMWKRAL